MQSSEAAMFAAKSFDDELVLWSKTNGLGMTDAMNFVHTPSNEDPVIVNLRRLLEAVDVEVLRAYGWDDISVSYSFHNFTGGSVNDPWRWALSEDVTTELMHRLTELNRQRFEELSQMPANAPRPTKRGRRSKAASSVRLDDLFAGDNA
ncbi:hypothetical protein D9M71_167090 [compost metagenome]